MKRQGFQNACSEPEDRIFMEKAVDAYRTELMLRVDVQTAE